MQALTIGKVAKHAGVGIDTVRFYERKGLIAEPPTVELIKGIACPSCHVSVLDMHDAEVARRAKDLGIRSVPAVVIDGKLDDCCTGRGVDETTLRAAGVGQPL